MRKPSCVRHWPCASSAATPRPKPASVPPGTAAGGTCCRRRSSRSGPGWPPCCAPSDGSRRRRRSSKNALLSRCAWRSSVHLTRSPPPCLTCSRCLEATGARPWMACDPRAPSNPIRTIATICTGSAHWRWRGSTRGTAPRRYARRPGWRWPTLVGRAASAAWSSPRPGRPRRWPGSARAMKRSRSSPVAPPPPADAYNHLGWLRAQAAVHAAGDDVGQATVAVTAVIAEAEHQCMRLDALWARPGPGHAADRSSAHGRGEGTPRCRVHGRDHGGDHRTATGRAASALARRADVAAGSGDEREHQAVSAERAGAGDRAPRERRSDQSGRSRPQSSSPARPSSAMYRTSWPSWGSATGPSWRR